MDHKIGVDFITLAGAGGNGQALDEGRRQEEGKLQVKQEKGVVHPAMSKHGQHAGHEPHRQGPRGSPPAGPGRKEIEWRGILQQAGYDPGDDPVPAAIAKVINSS